MLLNGGTDQDLPNLEAMSSDEVVAYLTQRLSTVETELQNVKTTHETELANAAAVHEAELAEAAAAHAAAMARAKADFESQMEAVLEQIRIANARYWGASTEKIRPEQLSLFNDVEAVCDPDTPDAEIDDVSADAPKKTRKPKRTKAELLDDLEVVVVEHDIAEDERICLKCGGALTEMNTEIKKLLKWIPGHFVVEEHRRKVYDCAICNTKNAQGEEIASVIVRAPMPHPPIEKAWASASTIAFIIAEKYAYSKPLYRIETTFAHGGVTLRRATMCNWVMAAASRWFALLRERMRQLLVVGDVIHCDETWVQVLKEPGREASAKSYMWVFATPECAVHQIVLYDYHPTRAAEVPKAFFKDWTGYIQCDGYDAYHNLGENITIAGCLAHVRRKYMDIAKGVGIANLPKGSATAQALGHLKRIFDMERTFTEMSPEQRKVARDKKLAPLLDAFFAWAKVTVGKALGNTAIKDALKYTVNQETYIRNILKDGRLDLTNNSCERRIRPFAIARRNNLFSDTPRGADASAILFSVVQSALANGLKPYEYLEWVLEKLPNAALNDNPCALDDFLPWSEKIPASFKMNSEEKMRAAKEPVLLTEPVDVEDLERTMREQERLERAADQD
jgi:transposase